MLANATSRADIQAASATTINFAASAALATRPIRLWAPSGRQAGLTALPTALTISGTAGTRYVYASLAAPSGDPYSTASGGILDRILSALSWNRLDWFNGFRAVHPGDGTLIDPARSSAVTFVETASATPPDTHHVPLGQFECAAGVITSVTSYEGQVSITVSAFIHGQCRLTLSGGNLKLSPYNGTSLVIGGTARAVPGAGVTLVPTGLTPGTFYDIYASWSGAAIVLEASTTGHATHTDGVEIKSGDSTRTYVGAGYIEAGPTWSTVVLVRSWFNDPNPTVLIREVGNPIKTLASSTTETSLWTAVPTLRKNSAAAGSRLKFTVAFDYLNNTGGGRQAQVRFKLGGTTFATDGSAGAVLDATATRYGFVAEAWVQVLGATNTEVAGGTADSLGDTGPTNAGVSGGNYAAATAVNTAAHSFHNALTADLATDLALDITAQLDSNSANHVLRPYALTVELVP